jgi:pseudaminic acid synthase
VSDEFQIDTRSIGSDHPVYIVAEMSANHGHDFERAVRILEEAGAAGADAVKLQTYTADTLTIDCDSDLFRIGPGSPWAGRSLYELYQEASTPWDWYPRLQAAASDLGLDLFSSPFDTTAVDFLERMHVDAYKVASFELVDMPLIRRIAATGKPTIMSTGLASSAEIEEAVTTYQQAGGRHLALLKCTSAYPAAASDMNLRTIPDMRRRFDVPVGLSDHSLDLAVAVTGVALGACILEKHFVLSRDEPGPDSAFSLEPEEFRQMVDAVRCAQSALGEVRYEPGDGDRGNRQFRRSLFVVEDVPAGTLLTADNVRSIRPAGGLHTRHFEEVLGRHASRDIVRGTPLAWELLDDA